MRRPRAASGRQDERGERRCRASAWRARAAGRGRGSGPQQGAGGCNPEPPRAFGGAPLPLRESSRLGALGGDRKVEAPSPLTVGGACGGTGLRSQVTRRTLGVLPSASALSEVTRASLRSPDSRGKRSLLSSVSPAVLPSKLFCSIQQELQPLPPGVPTFSPEEDGILPFTRSQPLEGPFLISGSPWGVLPSSFGRDAPYKSRPPSAMLATFSCLWAAPWCSASQPQPINCDVLFSKNTHCPEAGVRAETWKELCL